MMTDEDIEELRRDRWSRAESAGDNYNQTRASFFLGDAGESDVAAALAGLQEAQAAVDQLELMIASDRANQFYPPAASLPPSMPDPSPLPVSPYFAPSAPATPAEQLARDNEAGTGFGFFFSPPPQSGSSITVQVQPDASVDSEPAPVQTARVAPFDSPTMTAEQFAAAHPDLALNWNRAHDASWIGVNPGARAVVEAINQFPTFLDYLRAAYGGEFSTPVATGAGAATAASSAPAAGARLTAEQFANANPDLGNNWNRAHDASWLAANPGAAAIAAAINAYPLFIDYLRAAYGQDFAASAATTSPPGPTSTAPTGQPPPQSLPPSGGPVNLPPTGASPMFDPVHRLVGYTREGHEVYRLTDEGGRLVEWYDIAGVGATGTHYLSGPNHTNTDLAQSYVFSTTRPGPVTPGTGDANKSGTTGIVALGALALAAWALLKN